MSPASSPNDGGSPSPKKSNSTFISGANKLTSSYIMYLLIALAMSMIGIQRSSVLNIQEYNNLHHLITSTTTTSTSKTTAASTQHQRQEELEIQQSTAETTSTASTPTAADITPTTDHNEQQQNEQETTNTETTTKESDRTKPKKKLNIVLFYADDWTYYTLGAMGNKFVHTPNLDRLAQEDGILFTRNCVVTSVCMQSRATLYTGQYSSVHKSFYAWMDINMYDEGKWNETLYPTMLRNNYHTGFFGKYHHIEDFPIPTFTKYHGIDMNHVVRCHGQEKHVTQCNEDDGVNFLMERPKDEPFFLTLSFFATHAQDDNAIHYTPQNSTANLYTDDDQIPNPKTHTEEHWQSLPPFLQGQNLGRIRYQGRYDTPENYQHNMKRMYRMASEVDATCGRIMNLLKEQNVYDDTVIIFTTDNGNFHGEHGLSEKWYAYEESLRVPLIIKDPRMIPTLKGTVNDEFTLNIDLAPTILSAANVPVPHVMQGRDMATMYMGSNDMVQSSRGTWRKEFLYEFFWNNGAIPNSLALVGKDYKYIYWYDNKYFQYFNLTEDPYEENDIHSLLDPGLQKELHEQLLQLQISVQSGVIQ